MKLNRLFLCTLIFLLELSQLKADEAHSFCVAFGSCAHQDKPQKFWDPMVGLKPDLFIFMGDNIYADTTDMETLKRKYEKLRSKPGFQKLLKTCPIMATWDDHDYGENDAGREYPKKRESKAAFLDFFSEPIDSPRRKHEGIYDSKTWGTGNQTIQVILLDTRYFRSPLKETLVQLAPEGKPTRKVKAYVPENDPKATFLGEEQWQWLEVELKKPAALHLIVSSIQVIPEEHRFEKWGNFPNERERLFQLLKKTGTKGVILLSGDRHKAELSKLTGVLDYPLYEITSSGLTESVPDDPGENNQYRVGKVFDQHNFGILKVDWSLKNPSISLQIHNEKGETQIEENFSLPTLNPLPDHP